MSKPKKCGCLPEGKHQELVGKSMKQYGFYIHYIFNGHPTNFHTHGLIESFNHLDFQIALNMPTDTGMRILHNIVDRVREGTRFKHGEILEGIIANGYKVKLWQTVECGRPVLRLLIPDVEGRFPDDVLCTNSYKVQMEVDKF